MRVVLVAVVVLGALALAGCSSGSSPYTASATSACVRAKVALLLRPSRAAARESRDGPARTEIGGMARVGRDASGGDYELTTFPSENILFLHFAGSSRETKTLLDRYRSNLADQIGAVKSHRLVYRRRNVVLEWDQLPSPSEQRVAEQCLRSSRQRLVGHRWRPAAQPLRLSGAPKPVKLIPADAVVSHVWRVPQGGGLGPELAVSWKRIAMVDSALETQGLVVWERSGRLWRVVYSSRLPRELEGLNARQGDVNGDGHDDLLLFEDMGGSAGCGLYRVLAPTRNGVEQLFVRKGCGDYTRAWVRRSALVMYQGIVKDPRTANQIHCCWRVWQRTTIRWRGSTVASIGRADVARPPSRLFRSTY
jgi:outer membrane murein-binding lipoprotein Lpp